MVSKDQQSSPSYFRFVKSVIIVIPGVAILVQILPWPADLSRLMLLVFQEVTSAFILGAGLINQQVIRRMPKKKLNALTVKCFIASFLLLIGYLALSEFTTLRSPDWTTPVFVPLFADISKLHEGSFQEYLNQFGPAALKRLIEQNYKAEFISTTIILYIWVVLLFGSLTAVFTLQWMHQSKKQKAVSNIS